MPGPRKKTPMMQQYLRLKRDAGDALLFFRMGDFYELFLQDAEIAAPVLDIVLTSRDRNTDDPIPMCGIPFHAAEGYIRRLLQAGYSVAIAEQVEDPTLAKGLVRREIIEVVTPGLVTHPDRLEGAGANYVAALYTGDAGCGFAYLDVSTGEFAATQLDDIRRLAAELDRIAPREVVVAESQKELAGAFPSRGYPLAYFSPQQVFNEVGRLPEGIEATSTDPASAAAAALWRTAASLQPFALEQIHRVKRYTLSDRLQLDATTRRHLELVRNLQDGGERGTVLELLDHTRTPMGRRKLEVWLGEPLAMPADIIARQQRVAEWLEPDSRRHRLRDRLRPVGDLDRLLTRASLPLSNPRELAALRNSLEALRGVAEIEPLRDTLDDLSKELSRVIVDEPGVAPRGEPYVGYIRSGVSADLDQIRTESEDGNQYLATLEASERERTGIANLKVKYNRIFGYSIEVTKSHLARVPDEYQRKQTTANAERYTTAELQRWEGVVLRARERAAAVEARVLGELRGTVASAGPRIRQTAEQIAELDTFQSLADLARERGYVCPEIDGSMQIEIEAGRHPVVEDFVNDGFVPNDVHLDDESRRFLILTGPNMAGKSTLMRQVALIVLLAQLGSHVPAKRARIGVADRIFTRVGASDSLTTGESTFMVEMRETATIVNEATPRSLVILDEIGRGTSTFDGLSLAWAVSEYLHDAPGLRPRVLFATHYHELADLAQTKSGVRNFRFTCAERDGEILFLRRMEEGAASRSYGIEVARHAGLPPEVIRRAREVLHNLEGGEFDERGKPRLARAPSTEPGQVQLGLFSAGPDPLREALKVLDPEQMTPIEALNELARLKRQAEADEK